MLGNVAVDGADVPRTSSTANIWLWTLLPYDIGWGNAVAEVTNIYAISGVEI